MHWRTILILALVLAALGFLWKREQDSTGAGATEPYAMLFEGVDRDRIVGLRVEHLERSWTARFAREGTNWMIIDPVRYPAEPARIEQILELVARERCRPAPVVDPAEVGLDPPRVRVEVIEQREGAELISAVELGREDVDPSLIWVRVGDEVRLVSRSLFTTVDMGLDDFRSTRIPGPAPQRVLGLQRRGDWPVAMAPIGPVAPGAAAARALDLRVELGSFPLRVAEPFDASADPATLFSLVRLACELPVESFVSDFAAERADWGLEHPHFQLVFELDQGEVHEVSFGTRPAESELPPQDRTWAVSVAGWETLWEIDAGVAEALAMATEDLLDYELVRLMRDNVKAVELSDGARRVQLELPGTRWMVSQEVLDHASGALGAERQRADGDRVDGLLSLLDRLVVGRYLPGVPFPEGEVRGSFRVESSGAEPQHGRIGARYQVEDGIEGVLLQRGDETTPLLVDLEVEELLQLDFAELRTRHAVAVEEIALARIAIARPGGEARAWLRDERGRWAREGTGIEDRAFAPEVDRLRSVRVEAWLPGAALELAEVVEVSLMRRVEGELLFRVGLDASAAHSTALLELDGQQGLLRDRRLLELLVELLGE